MAKKFLDSEGLGIVWGKVKAEDLKIKNALTAEIDKKQDKIGNTLNVSEVIADTANIDHIQTDSITLASKDINTVFAKLGSNGKVPSTLLELPSYVDDVLEYKDLSTFPTTGEAGKIYVAMDTNKTYRWGGTEYVEISSSLALGTTESTAYPGNLGKQNATEIENNRRGIAGLRINLNEAKEQITGVETTANEAINKATSVERLLNNKVDHSAEGGNYQINNDSKGVSLLVHSQSTGSRVLKGAIIVKETSIEITSSTGTGSYKTLKLTPSSATLNDEPLATSIEALTESELNAILV